MMMDIYDTLYIIISFEKWLHFLKKSSEFTGSSVSQKVLTDEYQMWRLSF